MNNKNSDIANEQTLLINFIKDSERTQEETLKIFKEKVENIVSRGKDSSKSAKDEKSAKNEKEALSKAIEALYREASVIQNPFGKTVEAIMIEKGLTKTWRGKTILDVPKATKLTGLNANVFRTNMHKSECVVDIGTVISMCIGFKLSPILTDRLLQSAGLAFRLDNPEHLAYLFLLEYCMDYSVEQCNKILEKLGISKTKRLGSYGRGKNGESMEYKKRSKEEPK